MQDGRTKSTGALVLAAGMSSRMGGFKPMLKLGSMSFAERVIATFRQIDLFPVVVVTGYRADELERHIAGTGAICVRNERYAETEMFDSARVGLSYLEGKCDRTFLTPVDVPLFSSGTVGRMLECGEDVVRPSCRGRLGHPVLLSSPVIPGILSAAPDGGLGRVLGQYRERTGFVEVEDEGVLVDADTPEEYSRLVEMHNRQLLRPRISMSLAREQRILDDETALLLHVVQYEGTVKDACKALGISYRRAWNMINGAEAAAGMKLVDRAPGGEMGGGSSLTGMGEKLLDAYERFQRQVRAFADESFSSCFGEFLDRPGGLGAGQREVQD